MSGIDFTFTQISCTRCELFDTTNKLNHVQGTRTVHLLGIWSVGTVLSHFIPLVNNFPFILLLLYISSLQQFSWLQKIIGDTQTFAGKHRAIVLVYIHIHIGLEEFPYISAFKEFPAKTKWEHTCCAWMHSTSSLSSHHQAKLREPIRIRFDILYVYTYTYLCNA